MKLNSGFTLIELLVIIGVIGILATGLIVIINPTKQMDRTKNTLVQTHFNQMYTEIQNARISYLKVLKDITGTGCSDCTCRSTSPGCNDKDLRSDATCINRMTLSWNAISSRALPRDPWGNVYVWDENELESGGCGYDYIKSPGPDHKIGGPGCSSPDDITFQVPHFSCD